MKNLLDNPEFYNLIDLVIDDIIYKQLTNQKLHQAIYEKYKNSEMYDPYKRVSGDIELFLLQNGIIEKKPKDGSYNYSITPKGLNINRLGGFLNYLKCKVEKEQREVDLINASIEATKEPKKANKLSEREIWITGVIGFLTLLALAYQIWLSK